MQYIANTCEKLFYQLEYASCYFLFDMMKDTIVHVPLNVTNGSNTIVHNFFVIFKAINEYVFVLFKKKCLQHDYLSQHNLRAGQGIGPFLIQIKILTFPC